MKNQIHFEQLYDLAREALRPRRVSPFIHAGQVAAAIVTKQGNVYRGVCIDTACSLGMCAERNAIANMITNGESQITKLVCVMSDGSVGSPCGACREYLMQLDEDSKNIEILTCVKTMTTVKLSDLVPDWWGISRWGVADGDGR